MRSLYWILLISLIGAIGAWQYGRDDYPSDWPGPAIFIGSRGSCPNLTGTYDGVSESIPRILQGQDVWEKGLRPWFEHKAVVTQAEDGSWIKFDFELNERGLPKHREHVLKHGRGWPSGKSFTLNSKDHYDCGRRWLTLNGEHPYNGRVRLSRDRKGSLILSYTREELQGWTFYGNSGPTWKADVTRWHRWTPRPPDADAELEKVRALDVYRHKRHAIHGNRQLIGVMNFTGESVCLQIRNDAVPGLPAVRSATGYIGPRVVDKAGRHSVYLPCPAGWHHFAPLFGDNYFLELGGTPSPAHRLYWTPLKQSDAAPKVIDLTDPEALPQPGW